MDLNALITTLATAWTQITAIFVELVKGIDWNALIKTLSDLIGA